jgi:hypothetical protein
MDSCHKWLAEQGEALQELPEGNPRLDIRVITNENMKLTTCHVLVARQGVWIDNQIY